ncbi:MAG: hypothetical protein HY784_18625 [Chloroflexi bacterium]|nr:hypothetical protein [Chloroflexota bacterium]
MDILHLVDRLEELFNEGRHIPLTHQVAVDEDRILEIIDQMRVSIPEEVRQAKDIQARRDRIQAQAQEEAARTVELARKKAGEMADREAVAQAAQSRAEQIVAQAQYDAAAIRADADAYVMERLLEMEAELNRILNQVHNGINKLKAEQDQATGAPA